MSASSQNPEDSLPTVQATQPSPPEYLSQLLPGLRELWAETTGDARVCVAVIDGAVDLSHPCFASAQIQAAQHESPPSEHGTHVASTIFGAHHRDSPLWGVAPQCKGLLLPVFLQREDQSLAPCSQSDLARAISEAVRLGARIINISGGQLSGSGTAHPYLDEAVRQASQSGALIVSAVGNEGCECLHVPAALPGVLAVGGIDSDGRPLPFSNWGVAVAEQGLMAPGAAVPGAVPGGGLRAKNGTSFAAPLVSGVAALLLSRQLEKGDEPDPAAVRAALLDSATPCDPGLGLSCDRLLKGVLNLEGALDRLALPTRRSALAASSHAKDVSSPTTSETQGASTMKKPSEGAVPVAAASDHNLMAGNPSAAEAVAVVAADRPAGGETEAAVNPSCSCGGQSGESSEVRESSQDRRSELVPAAHLGTGANHAPATAGRLASPPLALPGRGVLGGGAISPSSSAPLAGSRPSAANLASQVRPAADNSPLDSPLVNPPLTFALGHLYYDFGTEARRDYFVAQIDPKAPFKVYDPVVMAEYLGHTAQQSDLDMRYWAKLYSDNEHKGTHPEDANGLIWTLMIDQEPIYAILPQDQYAVISYFQLVQFLWDQAKEGVERVAIAGSITGSVRLLNGQVVPTIAPVTRGMFDWNVKELLNSLVDDDGGSADDDSHIGDDGDTTGGGENCTEDQLKNFLERVYFELRNLGQTSADRAKNFAATNAFAVHQIFEKACKEGLRLDRIATDPSPICRADSDCWDVKLTFFDPKNIFERARQVFEFTIDVSDVVPVQVGEVRTFAIYNDPLTCK